MLEWGLCHRASPLFASFPEDDLAKLLLLFFLHLVSTSSASSLGIKDGCRPHCQPFLGIELINPPLQFPRPRSHSVPLSRVRQAHQRILNPGKSLYLSEHLSHEVGIPESLQSSCARLTLTVQRRSRLPTSGGRRGHRPFPFILFAGRLLQSVWAHRATTVPYRPVVAGITMRLVLPLEWCSWVHPWIRTRCPEAATTTTTSTTPLMSGTRHHTDIVAVTPLDSRLSRSPPTNTATPASQRRNGRNILSSRSRSPDTGATQHLQQTCMTPPCEFPCRPWGTSVRESPRVVVARRAHCLPLLIATCCRARRIMEKATVECTAPTMRAILVAWTLATVLSTIHPDMARITLIHTAGIGDIQCMMG